MWERNRDMMRGFLIAGLSIGAIVGLVAGGARLIHGPRHHERFKERIAETCTQAAYRVFERQGGRHHGPPPGPPIAQ